MHEKSEIISHHHHIPSLHMLGTIFAMLIGLTIVTVQFAYMDFGSLGFLVAMLVATVKAMLVSLYFMGLRWESGFNRLAFFASFVFVFLFIAFTLIDTQQNVPQIDWHETVNK